VPSLTDCKIFGDLLAKASGKHQKTVLQYMIKAAGPPEFANDLLISGRESDYAEKDRLLNLLWQNARAEKARSPTQKYKSNLYFQIAMCYLMGLGTKINEVEALKYLAIAAKNFAWRAMFMHTSVESSTDAAPTRDMPRRLFLCVAYLNDITLSVDPLKTSYPSLLVILKTIRFEKGLPLHRTICQDSSVIRGDDRTNALAESNDIFALIDSEDVDAVRHLLNDDPSLASEKQCGLSTLHALSLISDGVAAQMAIALLTAGASLDVTSYESILPWKNRLSVGHATPLTWAVVKQKPRLFASLVQWCIQHDISPNLGRRALGGLPILYRQSEMARDLKVDESEMVKQDATRAQKFFWSIGSENIPDDYQGGFDFAGSQTEMAQLVQNSPNDLRRSLLIGTLEENDINTVLRRWMLGDKYRASRSEIANLVAPWVIESVDVHSSNLNPIKEAMWRGDGISLLAFMHILTPHDNKCDRSLGRPVSLKHGDPSPVNEAVIHGTLLAPNMEAFNMLLLHSPDLVHVPSDVGINPLARASGDGNVEAVEKLLERKADVLHTDKNGSNAVVTALAYNQLLIADILLKTCDDPWLALGPNPDKVTAFGQVFGTYLLGGRHIQIETFDFFRKHDALSFEPYSPDNVWRMMLRKRRASLNDHRAADLRLLKYFLRKDVFGKHIDDSDWTGLTALHYAAQENQFEALEMLLDHGASVNIGKRPAKDRPCEDIGKTAADFALMVQDKKLPNYVVAGGAREVRAWQNRNKDMLKLLVDQGAKSGNSDRTMNDLRLEKIKVPQKWSAASVFDFAGRPPSVIHYPSFPE
jgi:ankyrin repeat protein